MLNPVRLGQKWMSTPKSYTLWVLSACLSVANAVPSDSSKTTPKIQAEKPLAPKAAPAKKAAAKLETKVEAKVAAKTIEMDSTTKGVQPPKPEIKAITADTAKVPVTDSAKAVAVEKAAPVIATPKVAEPAQEILDTTSDEHMSRTMSAAADSSAMKTSQEDSAKAISASLKETTTLQTTKLAHFKVGGILRTLATSHDFTAENDASKTASMGIDLARLSFSGGFENGYGFGAELDFAKSGGALNLGQVYMQWKKGAFDEIRAGRIKRMFSHEAMLSDNQLPFNFRGSLYQEFLNKTTGYSGYDVGVNFSSGFEDAGIPVHYQLGVYNGRRADTLSRAYSIESWKDADLKAKDLAFHVGAQVMSCLMLEAGLTTKTTEDKSDATNFDLAINTAYQVGAFYAKKDLRINAEMAYGDNHKGRDALIIDGSSNFLAFYLEAIVHHDYTSENWSELALKLEGLDPDMGFGDDEGKPNDGKFRYSLGATYGLNANNSLTLVWGFLHPITESTVSSDSRLRHDLDLYWKMAF